MQSWQYLRSSASSFLSVVMNQHVLLLHKFFRSDHNRWGSFRALLTTKGCKVSIFFVKSRRIFLSSICFCNPGNFTFFLVVQWWIIRFSRDLQLTDLSSIKWMNFATELKITVHYAPFCFTEGLSCGTSTFNNSWSQTILESTLNKCINKFVGFFYH